MNHRISSSSIKPILIALALFFLITTIAASLAVWQSDKSDTKSADMNKPEDQSQEVRGGEQAIGINIKKPKVAEEIAPIFNPDTDTSIPDTDTSIDAGESVKFRIENFQKLASQPLKFNIYNKDGSELVPDYIASKHGEKVHFFLAHANLREFLHLIPDYNNGVWNVQANMPTPGTYTAFIAVHPLGGVYTVYKKDLIVRNPSLENLDFPDPTIGLEVQEGRYKVKMDMEQTDEHRVFNYKVAANDVVTLPQANFEALGRMTILAHSDPYTFISLTASPTFTDTAKGLMFAANKLNPGRYTAFTEFKLDGKVYIFPFTFDIGT